jgi:TM2 domain-containing membrane protein YozV
MFVVLTEPALLTVALGVLGGYAGWQLGRRIVPSMAAATTAAALGAAWLISQTFEGAIQLYLYGVGASLGEALMTFVPIPLAIAATAVVASAGFRRNELGDRGIRPATSEHALGR